MVHQFQQFKIDENRRQLWVGERPIELQPRVFELLVYLARHQERVVPKDELLDVIWDTVTVADGSLQRAVSLARSALAAAGVTGVIETYPRFGYRLGNGGGRANSDPPARSGRVSANQPEVIDSAVAPREEEDWAHLSERDLMARSFLACFEGQTDAAIRSLEAVFTSRLATGQGRSAAWVGLMLGQVRFERRELILASGWRHRAARLLADEAPGKDHGYLAWLESRLASMEDDAVASVEAAERCRVIGERCGDPDLEALGLLGIGEGKMLLGNIREGLAALDETGVAAGGGSLSPWAGGLVFCGLIYFCMARCDWQRAGEWTAQFTRWTEETGGATYPGLCRLHRTEVLALRGEIGQAKIEAREARLILAQQNPWTEGAAWAQEGEIALAVGDFAEARVAFQGALAVDWDSRFELALLTLFEGEAVEALREFNRLLEEDAWSYRIKRGRALAYHVMAAAQAGEIKTAEARLAELMENTDLLAPRAMQGLLRLAQAEVAHALGRPSDAVKQLRAAVRVWADLGTLLMLAHTRCRLSQVLVQQGDEAGALVEHEAACVIFQRVEASLALERCRQRFAAAGATG